MSNLFNTFIKKYGAIIVTCAFAFAIVGTNTACTYPFYEPKEPSGLERLKRHAE